VRKAPSPRRRWRREVQFCLYDGKSSMRSPRLRRCWPRFIGGRCTRFALPHASSITRETPGVVARILPMSESKVLRRPDANYAPMLRSCNGSRQHFLRLLRARHVERASSMTSFHSSAVIPREGGVSSTPQLLDALRASLEYWITGRSLSSGAHSRDPLPVMTVCGDCSDEMSSTGR
jgi:hypothetical protein